MSVTGVVLGVSPDWRGSDLTVATTTDTTVLSVVDAVDFDEDGGWLVIADETTPRQYVSVDFDADTVTLAAAVGAVFEEHLPVSVWDVTTAGGSRVVEYVAQVDLDGGAGPMDATVPHDLVPSADTDALVGASVVVEEAADDDSETPEWVVVSVVGREPVFSGTYIEPGTLPAAGSGQTFSTDAPPATADGYAEDHAWWQVVDGEVLGFWRASLGVWVAQEIVTAEALRANNAFIDALQTVDLSTVNLEAVNIAGGSIYVAQGTAGEYPQPFSGTALPAGWTMSRTLSGTWTAPNPAVISSGYPAGGSGSVLLLDTGAANQTDGSVGLEVRPDYQVGDFEVLIKHQFSREPDLARGGHVDLCISAAGDDMYRLDLGGNLGAGAAVHEVVNGTLGAEVVSQDVGTWAAGWYWVRVRKTGQRVALSYWRDGDPEPPAVAAALSANLAGGSVAINAGASSFFGASDALKLWIDQFDVTTYATGFNVNPDGTGEWPAIGLRAGDSAWRVVGNAGEQPFTNSWTEFSTDSVQFRKFPTGEVTIVADVKIPTDGHATSIFTLPDTHRPQATYANMFAWQNGGNRTSVVTVDPDGTVVWANMGNTGGTRTSFSVTFSTL